LLYLGGSRRVVVLGLENTPAYRAPEVTAVYRRFLHHGPDAGSLGAWVAFLPAGATVEQVEIALFRSAAYFAVRGGGPLIAFLEALCVGAMRAFFDFIGHAGIVHTPQFIASSFLGCTHELESLFQEQPSLVLAAQPVLPGFPVPAALRQGAEIPPVREVAPRAPRETDYPFLQS
jgi:hypothetical protein